MLGSHGYSSRSSSLSPCLFRERCWLLPSRVSEDNPCTRQNLSCIHTVQDLLELFADGWHPGAPGVAKRDVGDSSERTRPSSPPSSKKVFNLRSGTIPPNHSLTSVWGGGWHLPQPEQFSSTHCGLFPPPRSLSGSSWLWRRVCGQSLGAAGSTTEGKFLLFSP